MHCIHSVNRTMHMNYFSSIKDLVNKNLPLDWTLKKSLLNIIPVSPEKNKK